ncbi:uncharacterized protein BJ171DRAFT_511713 [Polychytrium aggregatum]|uniref:uncharacterized protein n=1 Tax=Polychytrium aggregatum TaxID=110093 RepID=UPI0022FEE84F|nr:uncharacterized protein BJ171DRAFT_511713 [Polychytrium aggregatum]KAI9203074.1 hypothetical protein BJ171DRAFT_511713 [Polychytrium aggregatum]
MPHLTTKVSCTGIASPSSPSLPSPAKSEAAAVAAPLSFKEKLELAKSQAQAQGQTGSVPKLKGPGLSPARSSTAPSPVRTPAKSPSTSSMNRLSSASTGPVASEGTPPPVPGQAPTLPPIPDTPPPPPPVKVFARALADYTPAGEGQLKLIQGANYRVLIHDYGKGWTYGETEDGTAAGIFPQSFIQLL